MRKEFHWPWICHKKPGGDTSNKGRQKVDQHAIHPRMSSVKYPEGFVLRLIAAVGCCLVYVVHLLSV